MIFPEHARGVALLDVLLAMLVLAIGLLSIAPLQGLIARSNIAAWQRAMAGELAQQKLEDLRGFAQLDTGSGAAFGYDDIANNSGGLRRSDSILSLPAGAIERSGNRYTLSWSVSEIAWCDGVETRARCTRSWRSDAKLLRVMVTWSDEAGASQELSLESIVAALEPANGATALLRRPLPRTPQIERQ